MTAATEDLNTPRRASVDFEFDAAAGAEIFAGVMVALDTSGNAEMMTKATGKIAAGVCQEYVDNTTGVAGTKRVKVRQGAFRFVNGESITKAHIGDAAYAEDNQTIYRTATGRSQVGTIVDVETDGVWVMIASPLAAAATGLLAANNLGDVGSASTSRSNLQLGDAFALALQLTGIALNGTATYRVVSPVNGTITNLQSVISGALATGNAVLTFNINATPITGGVITILQAGSAAGDVDSATPTAANVVSVGDVINVVVSGANTAAETAMATVRVNVTPA